MYASILPTERHPVAKRVIIAEAETDAPKPLRGAPDGTGYRDMARSESSAQELGRPADGKPTAGVGGVRSSGEAGNDRGAKGLCPKSVSKGSGAERLRKRHLTEKEIREIGAKRNLTKYPDLALMTERLARKAEAEPKSRFHNLYRWVLHDETMRCAWERVKANGISAERSSLREAKSLERCAPGVDGVTFQMIERGEGGAEGFIKGIQKELHEKTYRASPLRRKYIEKGNGKMRPLGIPTIKDRVVQCAVKIIIEPIFEKDFHDCSFDFREPHTTLTFLGYEFRMVRDRLFGTGKRYLTFGPSKKSMKRVREKIHGITHARNGLLTVEKVVERLNKLTKGWGAFYSVGYPSKAFHAVNGYALRRMARHLNHRSQRRYRLKFADTYYGELNHYGMYWLKWADVRRGRY